MQTSVLPGIAMFAVSVAIFAGDWPGASAATVQQCNTNHVICQGQCASMYVPQNPAPSELCKANCASTLGTCIGTASDRSAAPPPAGQPKRTPDTAASGPRPSLLERDTSPVGTSPAPTGRPAGAQGGTQGAGGPQLR